MAKKVPLTKFPDAATVTYSRAIQKMIDALAKHTMTSFDKYIAPKLKARQDALYIEDGIFDGLKRFFNSVRVKMEQLVVSATVEKSAVEFTHNVNRFNRHNVEQQMAVKNIDLVATEPWVKDFVAEKVKDNVGYIKTIHSDYFDGIENIVSNGIANGASLKSMREQLVRQADISKSKAQFIAVDQAGSMLGQMTAQRHQRLGIEKFIWDTSGDERVRASHRKLDGKVFSYDAPPEVNGRIVLPGEDYRCRCIAMPVFEQ